MSSMATNTGSSARISNAGETGTFKVSCTEKAGNAHAKAAMAKKDLIFISKQIPFLTGDKIENSLSAQSPAPAKYSNNIVENIRRDRTVERCMIDVMGQKQAPGTLIFDTH